MGAMQDAGHDDPLGSLHWPPIVPEAITLRGAELSEAILRGYKDIENRTIRLEPGWVAVHTGKQSIEARERVKIEALCPGLSAAASCPKGAIVGVCLVQRCLPFEALRREQGCGRHCDLATSRHSPSCRLSPFAAGAFSTATAGEHATVNSRGLMPHSSIVSGCASIQPLQCCPGGCRGKATPMGKATPGPHSSGKSTLQGP